MKRSKKAEYGTLVASVYNLINSNYFHFFVKKLFALDESNLVFIAEVAKKKNTHIPYYDNIFPFISMNHWALRRRPYWKISKIDYIYMQKTK